MTLGQIACRIVGHSYSPFRMAVEHDQMTFTDVKVIFLCRCLRCKHHAIVSKWDWSWRRDKPRTREVREGERWTTTYEAAISKEKP